MARPLQMPALSPTMTEGVVARWCKAEGESFRSGDILAEIETDKATMELEAADDGVLGRQLAPEGGAPVAVGAAIALVLEEGEDAAALDEAAAAAPAPAADGAAAAPAPAPSPPAGPAPAPALSMAAEAEGGESAASEPEWSGAAAEQTVREALRDAMAEEMRRDERVFLMGEEVGEYQGPYKASVGMLEEFGPRRVVDTPITEHGFAGIGVGAAFAGLRPIVEFMTFNFAMQAMDQLVNSAAKTRYMSGGAVSAPIVFRGPNGAAARVAAQHSQCYAAWYAHIPGLAVLAPATAADAKGLLKSAIRSPDPVVFLENELLYGAKGEVPEDADFTLPFGKARIARPGRDVTLAAFSIMVPKALAAAEALAGLGIEAEVLDLRSLRPLDAKAVLASVRRTHRFAALEEGWGFAGVGAELAALVATQAFDWLDAPPLRIHAADAPLPYAASLEAAALPGPEDVVAQVRALVGR